jgi:hypothetical protein
MSEARKLDRARSILGAHIIFNNRNSTIDCQIRNISKSGARLAISNTFTLPEEFDIEVPQKGRTYRARLCWRDAQSAGIEFVLDTTDSSGRADNNSRIAELEAENAALRLRIFDLREKLDAAMAAIEKAERAA